VQVLEELFNHLSYWVNLLLDNSVLAFLPENVGLDDSSSKDSFPVCQTNIIHLTSRTWGARNASLLNRKNLEFRTKQFEVVLPQVGNEYLV
jgi:hypothetical protein